MDDVKVNGVYLPERDKFTLETLKYGQREKMRITSTSRGIEFYLASVFV